MILKIRKKKVLIEIRVSIKTEVWTETEGLIKVLTKDSIEALTGDLTDMTEIDQSTKEEDGGEEEDLEVRLCLEGVT